MKQAEEAKRQSHDSARRILEDYGPLKHEVDLMRTELLGLEKLPEFATDEKEKLGTLGYVDQAHLYNSVIETSISAAFSKPTIIKFIGKL